MNFMKDGYCYLPAALDTDLMTVAREYTLFDESENYNSGDGQVQNAHARYADPLMESLLMFALPMIEEATGLSLLPTYSYYRVYRRGNELKPHVDRPACEISASLCIGYTDDSVEWPLYVADTPYVMRPGDLLIYRGLDLNHYRYPLECEYSWSQSQAFLHYVDAEGAHAEWKFDKRKALGVTKKGY